MPDIAVDELEVNSIYDADLHLGALMALAAGVPVPSYFAELLLKWGFPTVETSGKVWESQPRRRQDYVVNKGAALIEKDRQNLANLMQLRRLCLTQISNTFTRYRSDQLLLSEELLTLVQNLNQIILGAPTSALRLTQFSDRQSLLISYALNSVLLAIALATRLTAQKHKALTAGCAALLYCLATTNLAGDRADRQHFDKVIAYLKQQRLPVGALDSIIRTQERQARDSPLIDQIVGLSCSYCHGLAHLQEQESPHGIILGIIREQKYSSPALKELLALLSLFPIGSFVVLQEGLIGMVFAPSAHNPRYPLVLIEKDEAGDLDQRPTLIATAESFPVVKALPYQQWAVVKKKTD